jgi:gamma-glutamyltranspeptidase
VAGEKRADSAMFPKVVLRTGRNALQIGVPLAARIQSLTEQFLFALLTG